MIQFILAPDGTPCVDAHFGHGTMRLDAKRIPLRDDDSGAVVDVLPMLVFAEGPAVPIGVEADQSGEPRCARICMTFTSTAAVDVLQHCVNKLRKLVEAREAEQAGSVALAE